jgi:tungstate transport system ATP-binding protein
MKTENLWSCRDLGLGYPARTRAWSRPAEPVPAFVVEALDIAEGECLALVGPNGSGKTTLLKALNGLLAPLSGNLLFRGSPASGSAELRRRSVYLHQAPYILAGSVSYNVLYGARARGLEAAEAHERARGALDLLGIDGFGHRHSRALSGGEAQRVALARALASGADILLLDEPTASADAASADLVLAALRARRDAGDTIVFSTHDPDLAEALATRTLRLRDGRIQGE